jgi:hypothetical protein
MRFAGLWGRNFGKRNDLSNMKKIVIISVCLILGVGIILVSNLLSHKPKGIDPTPLYYLQIPDDLDVCSIISNNDSVLAKKYHCKCRVPEGIGNWLLLSIPVNDTNKYVGREILIMQSETYSDALEWYLFHKGSAKIDSKIYKEKERYKSKYFMAYQAMGIDFNHGIPFISNYILLEFGFLINNYFVFISYTDFSATSKKNYKNNINNDIILVSELFNDVLIEYKNKNTDEK